MPRFRPDVKPPCWGPPDAVQFAVRANCERLGIDHTKIDGYWPLFERGGGSVFDVVHGGGLSVGAAASWGSLGVQVSAATDSIILGTNSRVAAAATNLTCLLWAHGLSLGFSDSKIMSTRSAWNDTQGFVLETSSARFRFRHQTSGGRVDITSIVDIRTGAGPVIYRADAPQLFGVAYGQGTCSFYLDPKNVPPDIVSHSSTGIIASARQFQIGNGVDSYINSLTVAASLVVHDKIEDATVVRLAYEPYVLLMPVARPLYFDLGAAAGTDELTASNLTVSSPVLGTPALGQAHALTASGITVEGPVLGAPTLAQIHALVASGLTVSAPVVGTPELAEVDENTDELFADDLVVGSPALGTPTLGQIHALTANDLAVSSPVLGTPAVSDGTEQPSTRSGGGIGRKIYVTKDRRKEEDDLILKVINSFLEVA